MRKGMRAVERQPCDWEVRYRAVAGRGVRRAAAVNVSACGICLRTARRLPVHEAVWLWARGAGLFEEARVRWVREAADGGYLAGFSFSPPGTAVTPSGAPGSPSGHPPS